MVGEEATELLTPEEWVEQARSESVKKKRTLLVRYWVAANSFPSAAEGIKQVQNGHLYKSFDTAVKFLESRGLAPNTLAQWRGGYRDFAKACVTDHFDNDRFESLVKQYQGYTVTEKLCPTVDQFRDLLLKGDTREKALVSVLGVWGGRIMEGLTRKWSDIEFDYKLPGGGTIPARVRVAAGDTKKKYLRYGFFPRETVQLLKDYRALLAKNGVESEWVFPAGDTPATAKSGGHLDYFNTNRRLKELFRLVGLVPKNEDQIYSPHSFRSFAQMVMRKSGFSDTWNQLIVGHRNLETKSYKGNWDEIGASWMEKVEPHMNFLTAPTEDVKKLEGALKAQKAEFETQKAQWEQITKDMAVVRDALRKATETKNYSELTDTIARVKNDAQARMSSDKPKRFDNHVWSYVKCRMADPEFDEALIEGYEVLLQSPDGWVTLRKPKAQPEVDEGTATKVGSQ